MKSIIVLTALLCIPIAINSQTLNTKYKDDIEEVNEYLEVNEFSDALPILEKLEKNGYGNANVWYKLGLCYVNSFHDKAKAISYLERASKNVAINYNIQNIIEKNAPAKALLYLGDAYRVNNRLIDAVRAYKSYLSFVRNNSQDKAFAEKRILESQLAQTFIKNPVNVQFTKLNHTINDGIGNFNVCISGDGKALVFNRRMKFYDAIFFCTRTNGDWTEPKEITTQVGSDGEFHPTGLSPDGRKMLLSSFNDVSGYDIHQSEYRDGKWRKIKILSNIVNSPFYDVDAVYGADGKSIYFCSNRTSGYGGFDIYKSSIDEAGNAEKTENLGAKINSEWDEKSPSFNENGELMIFSSQRKPGIGGFDFFYAKQAANGEWGDVYNAGYPLSTVNDDLGFSNSLSYNEGVLSKHEQGSLADEDIFNVKFDVLSKFKMISLAGEIKLKDNDELSYNGLNLYFIDENIKDTVGTIESPEGGKYKIDLYPGNFKLVMSKEKFVTVSQIFTMNANESKTDYRLVSEFKTEREKTPVHLGSDEIRRDADTIYMADILFEFNKSSISSKEKGNIDSLIHKLRTRKIDRIEFVGFTDCFGNKFYNKKLSEQRASSVKNLFIEKGVSTNIMICIGLGDSTAVAKNVNADGSDNPNGRAYNRRVEIHSYSSDRTLILFKKDNVPVQLKP